MIRAARRILRRLARRSFEAAAGGRRWDGIAGLDNLNAATFAGNALLRKRGRHFYWNNPWVANGINTLTSNLVGSGIQPQSQHPSPEARKAIHGLFARWTDQADAAGLTDFFGLQAMVARAMVGDGESLARFRLRQPEDGLAVPVQIQALAIEHLDQAMHRDLESGSRIRAGVEFDAIGRRAAYHIFPDHPGDPLGAISLTPSRLPASEVLHVFVPMAAGQVRGISWLTPILLRLHELDQFEDATAVGQKIRAMFAGFIRDVSGDGGGFAETNSKELLEHGLEPGTLRVLPPGTDITFSDPSKAGDSYESFVQTQLRAIAAGLGVTYEQLTGDMRGVNFSSARVALIEFRRRIEALQEQVLVAQFCRPVWERFIRVAILSGALPARDFDQNAAAWLSAKWMPPGWDWVDPLKDAQAEALAVKSGFKSRSEVIAQRGWDVEMVDAEIARDQARAEQLGLKLGETAQPTPPAEGSQDNA